MSEPWFDELAEWLRIPSVSADPDRAGDVIRHFDGQDVSDSTQLPWLASSAGIGHRAQVEFYRGGHVQTVTVTLGAMPDRQSIALPQDRPGMVPIPPPSGP